MALSPISPLGDRYWTSQTYLTVNLMGLFTVPAAIPTTAEATTTAVAAVARPARLLLNACRNLGLWPWDDGVIRERQIADRPTPTDAVRVANQLDPQA